MNNNSLFTWVSESLQPLYGLQSRLYNGIHLRYSAMQYNAEGIIDMTCHVPEYALHMWQNGLTYLYSNWEEIAFLCTCDDDLGLFTERTEEFFQENTPQIKTILAHGSASSWIFPISMEK